MPNERFRLSRRADRDLIDIYLYTLERFGVVQAERYARGIEGCFDILAGNPRMGRAADDIRPGVHRHEHESHVIFYREDGDAILILAVVHRRMRPDLGL